MHFTTPIWDKGKNNCPSKVICGCSGEDVKIEKPPLLFDLEEDISESKPIPPNSPLYSKISKQINLSLSLIKPKLLFPPSSLHSLFNPFLMPFCKFIFSSPFFFFFFINFLFFFQFPFLWVWRRRLWTIIFLFKELIK